MGIKVEETSQIFGANKAVIMNMQVPSSTLKRSIILHAFHKSRETIAAGICQAEHKNKNKNTSDLLTLSLGQNEYYNVIC